MPTPKKLKWALEGKYIDVRTSSYGLWHKKRYKVLGYDPETDLYTLSMTKVEGPLEHLKLKAENIEVFEETISLTDSESEPEDNPMSEDEAEVEDDVDMKVSTPFTIEGLKKMSRDKVRQECKKYDLFTPDWKYTESTASECREALAKKFGLEGSTTSDYQQKVEESSNALDAFLLLPFVVAITSTISKFNPKNRRHAERFMKEYRKRNGKGTTRSRK